MSTLSNENPFLKPNGKYYSIFIENNVNDHLVELPKSEKQIEHIYSNNSYNVSTQCSTFSSCSFKRRKKLKSEVWNDLLNHSGGVKEFQKETSFGTKSDIKLGVDREISFQNSLLSSGDSGEAPDTNSYFLRSFK